MYRILREYCELSKVHVQVPPSWGDVIKNILTNNEKIMKLKFIYIIKRKKS